MGGLGTGSRDDQAIRRGISILRVSFVWMFHRISSNGTEKLGFNVPP